jgi:plasmid stabilization system protein ParE
MNRWVLSDAAEMDLEAIRDYITQDSLDAADRWIEKLRRGLSSKSSRHCEMRQTTQSAPGLPTKTFVA